MMSLSKKNVGLGKKPAFAIIFQTLKKGVTPS
jgi:hypothetical protein